MSGRKKQNASQQWRTGWRTDVLKIRDGIQFESPHKPPQPSNTTSASTQFPPLSREESEHISSANVWWQEMSGGRNTTWILAPMVAQSDRCFRLLCREAGVHICYTPMYLADRINTGVHDKELMLVADTDTDTDTDKDTDTNPATDRDTDTSNSEQDGSGHEHKSCSVVVDRPLVCQIAGNNSAALLQAAQRVQSVVDAVDLNYGCPQRCAEDAGFGAFFLERNPDLACAVVKELSQALRVPVLVKMRLHAEGEIATVRWCLCHHPAWPTALAERARGPRGLECNSCCEAGLEDTYHCQWVCAVSV